MKNIVRMDGFDTLTFEQKLLVLNNSENFMGLSEAANKSKGSKSYVEWVIYKKENIAVDLFFRAKMIETEKAMEIQLQQQIDNFNKLNQK